MLILTRKPNEAVLIGDNIEVVVVEVDRGKVRLGISAPKDVSIRRTELLPPDHEAHPNNRTGGRDERLERRILLGRGNHDGSDERHVGVHAARRETGEGRLVSLTTITRRLEWDAGHRVLGHTGPNGETGKCARLHGHRYCAELTVTAPDLDKLGRVIDFSVLKSVVGKWVDDNLDHNMMLHPDDPLYKLALYGPIKTECYGVERTVEPEVLFAGKTPYVMKSGNPTAENIACELFTKAAELLAPHNITAVKVRVWETPNCWAEYSAPA